MLVAEVGRIVSAAIDNSSDATFDLVAAVACKQVIVFRIMLICGSATTLDLKDGSTSKTGPMGPMTSWVVDEMTNGKELVPLYSTTAGNALKLAKGSAAVQVSGTIWYLQE